MGIVLDFFNRKVKEKEMLEFLNPFNIETITRKEIKIYDKKFLKYPEGEDHKRKVIKTGIKSQTDFNTKLHNKVKSFLKKLNIKPDKEIEKLMFSLERREFTNRRAFKQIEIPFGKVPGFENKYAIGYFRDVKVLDNNSKGMREIARADLYLLKDDLVGGDSKEKEIKHVMHKKDLLKITKQQYGLEVKLKKGSYIMRYIDNEVLFIALKRTYKKVLKGKTENFTREFELTQELTKEFKL